MRYLKSILIISLLSISIFQANANTLTVTATETVVPPKHIIEIIDQGKIILITNILDDNIVILLTDSRGEVVHNSTLSSYDTISLINLASGVYQLSAVATTSIDEVYKTIIIK